VTPGPLTAASAVTSWQVDLPVLLGVAIATLAYLAGVRSRGDWPVHRTLWFLVAMAGIVVVESSFLGVYDHVLFWALSAQDVLLLALLPVPLVLSHPLLLLGRTPSHRWSAAPLIGSVAALAVLLSVYVTGWDLARLRHESLFNLTHLLLLLAGCSFVGPLLADSGASYGLRTLLAFVDGLLDAVPGLAVLGTHALIASSWYAAHPRSWGPTPAKDQQLGGTAMIALSELVGLPAFVAVVAQWVRADARDAARVDAELDVLDAAREAISGEGMSGEGVSGEGVSGEREPELLTPWWVEDPRYKD
jgi:cytochrome c oxidase assembly factor CtaG